MSRPEKSHAYEYVTLRQKVLNTFCPQCGALPGKKCIGGRGQVRSSMHADRWESFRNLNPLPKTTSQ